MQNAECRTQPKMFTLYVQDAGCRMQDAESVPKWILLHGAGWQDAECRMQNQTHAKEIVRWVQLTALGPILHSAFCICILHRVPVHSFGPDSAFCILHLHPAWVAVHSFVRGRFCIPRYHLLRSANGATRPGGRT